MAFQDYLTTFAENFDLDQETGTFLLTNQIDSQLVSSDLGSGKPLYLNVVVEEAFTDGGDSATLELRLVSDDTAAIHASTSTLHLSSGTFLKAALTAGKRMSFPLPTSGKAYEEYLGVNAVVGTAGFDSGEITAWLSHEAIADITTYADGRH